MAVNFGSAGDTGCLHNTAGDFDCPAAMSIYFWFRGAFTTAYQNFLFINGALDFYWDRSVGGSDRIFFSRSFTGTDSTWRLDQADYGVTPSTSTWTFLAVTHANSTADPSWYMAQATDSGPVARTHSGGTSPTGSPESPTGAAIHIGNYSDDSTSLGGDMAYFGLHNVELTEGELSEAMWRGMTTRGLVLATPMFGTTDVDDVSGNGLALTANGNATTVNEAPPVLPLWVPSYQDHVIQPTTGEVKQVAVAVAAQSSVTVVAGETPEQVAVAVAGQSTVTIAAVKTGRVAPSVAATSTVAITVGETPEQVQVSVAGQSTVTIVASQVPERVAVAVAGASTVAITCSKIGRTAAAVVGTSAVSIVCSKTGRVTPAVAATSVVTIGAVKTALTTVAVAGQSTVTIALTTFTTGYAAPFVAAFSSVDITAYRVAGTQYAVAVVNASSSVSIAVQIVGDRGAPAQTVSGSSTRGTLGAVSVPS